MAVGEQPPNRVGGVARGDARERKGGAVGARLRRERGQPDSEEEHEVAHGDLQRKGSYYRELCVVKLCCKAEGPVDHVRTGRAAMRGTDGPAGGQGASGGSASGQRDASQSVTAAVCFSRNTMQLSICSSVCSSVRVA